MLDPVLAHACQRIVAAQPGAAGALSTELTKTAAAVAALPAPKGPEAAALTGHIATLEALAAALKS